MTSLHGTRRPSSQIVRGGLAGEPDPGLWADDMARKERMRIEFPATVQAEEAAQQALAKQHAEARAKLAWDMQNAAPAMYEQQNIGAQQLGKLFKQG